MPKSSSKKAALIGRQLPSAAQITSLSQILGSDITNLALSQQGATKLVPHVPDPPEVTETRATLSVILSEMQAITNAEIDLVQSQGGISMLDPEERRSYSKMLSQAGKEIGDLEKQWEEISGFTAQRAARAALTSAVTSAIVEAIAPVTQLQQIQTTDQSHSKKVDEVIFGLENEEMEKKLPQRKTSCLDLDFDLETPETP
jgi:hypothetical protein